jgi:tetratricopeptide (TPR) repeat protein
LEGNQQMQMSVDRRPATALLIVAFLLGTMTRGAWAQDNPDATAARVNFGAHISAMAQSWGGQLAQTAAMMRAAMKSDPRDPRYPRLLASAEQQLKDVDGELAALNAYRQLVPEDRVAETRVIELYASKMQTADEKLKYLRGLLGKTSLPVEVRAYLASLCLPLLLDRSNDEAIAMVADGIKLYPLPALVQWQYQLVARHGTPVERVAGLLELLKSNPIQPLVVDAIARELAGQGMASEAAEWFNIEFNLKGRMGIQSDPQFALDVASELYQAGQTQAAQEWISKVLNVDRDNVAFWFMELTLQRSTGDRTGMVESADMTRDVLQRRWAYVNSKIPNPGGAPLATQPASGHEGDPLVVLQKLRAAHDPQLNEAFAVTLEDMVWFALFYENNPKSAEPFLHALEQSLPADNVTLQRLQGWYLAETGKETEAHAALAAVADRDPFAAVAVIRLDRAKDPQHTRDKLRQLLTQYPMGLAAAVIREALISEEAPRPTTNPATAPAVAGAPAAPATAPAAAPGSNSATADAIRAELQKFPSSWLSLIDQPRLFYTVAAESMQTIVHFGDPLMARVTLTNTSNQDLVIGFGGPISPALWVDAKVSGIAQQEFQAVALDQVTGPIVLRGHGSTSQIIRVDQGPLGELIRQRANGSMIVSGNIMTNPTPFGQGIGPGAGGEYMTFLRSFVREPSELQTAAAQRDLHDDFTNGAANDRIRDLDLMGSFVAGMDKETDQTIRDSSDLYIHYITKARSDPTPEVAALAGYLAATLPGVPGRADTIDEMLRSAAWQTRLLGLAAARQQPVDVQQRLCGPVAEADADPIVRSMAIGVMDALKAPASTQPATAPAAN